MLVCAAKCGVICFAAIWRYGTVTDITKGTALYSGGPSQSGWCNSTCFSFIPLQSHGGFQHWGCFLSWRHPSYAIFAISSAIGIVAPAMKAPWERLPQSHLFTIFFLSRQCPSVAKVTQLVCLKPPFCSFSIQKFFLRKQSMCVYVCGGWAVIHGWSWMWVLIFNFLGTDFPCLFFFFSCHMSGPVTLESLWI